MSEWRTIITDSESLTGVAPRCPQETVSGSEHHIGREHPIGDAPDDAWVYVCCPQPHIECFSEQNARLIARALTETEAVAL